MPDSSLHTMTRIRTTLFNQKQRAIQFRAQTHRPTGITLAVLNSTNLDNDKILEQDSYIIPDSPFRRPPKLVVAGETIYRIGDKVTIYINNVGGPAKIFTASTLPTGLSIDPIIGTITGTATIRQSETQYSVLATNDFGQDTVYFSIKILYRPPNIFYSGSPFNFIKNTGIIPASITNTSDPFETVTGNLPDGLTVDINTGVISGIPTTVSSQESYFITATNEGGSDTTEILIQVWIEAPDFHYAYGPYLFTINNPITPFSPSNILGNPTFFIPPLPAPQLPLGLLIDSNTGEISGMPLVVTTSNEYAIQGSNLGPSGIRTHTDYIGMEVLDAPPNISYSPSTVTFTQNSLITPIIVTNTGGAITSFSVTPAFPSGITLNTTTGTISGTPLVDSSATSYSITATGNGTSTTSINITINPAAPFISYATPQNYAVGTAITPLVPTISGGTVSSYAVVGSALPTGLTLNTTTGVISGTPTTLAYVANFAIQASNITGTSTAYIDIAIVRPTPLGIGSYNWAGALSFNGQVCNFVTGVVSDSSNNAYITGYYRAESNAVIYNSNISASNTTALPLNPVAQVGYYAKYNSNGNFEYASCIRNVSPTSNTLFNNSITLDTNSNIYICGRYSGGATIFNSNISSSNENMLPSTDAGGVTYGAYAIKFNPQGSNVLRCGFVALVTGSASIAEAADVKVDSAGSIYISGSYRATSTNFTLSFCNNIATGSNFLPITTGTNFNSFLVKFNSNGSLAWGAAIGNTVTGNPISNYSMAIDSVDNIYLTGSYYGNSNNIFIYSSNYSSSNCNVISSRTSLFLSESYIVKFGSNGSFISAASLNACNYNAATSIAIDSVDNVYVSGLYSGLSNTTYVHSSNKSSSNNNVLPSITTGNAQYLLKFNNNLQFQMALAVDSRTSFSLLRPVSASVSIDANNNIYLVGTTSNNYNMRAYNSNQSAITSNLIRTGSGEASYMVCFGANGQVKYGTSLTNSTTSINNTILTYNTITDTMYLAGTYSATSNSVVAYDSNSNYFSSNIVPSLLQAGTSNAYLLKYQV